MHLQPPKAMFYSTVHDQHVLVPKYLSELAKDEQKLQVMLHLPEHTMVRASINAQTLRITFHSKSYNLTLTCVNQLPFCLLCLMLVSLFLSCFPFEDGWYGGTL